MAVSGARLASDEVLGHHRGMPMKELFTAALGLGEDWEVEDITFAGQPRTLTLRLRSKPGLRFALTDEPTAMLHPVHDTVERTWRH